MENISEKKGVAFLETPSKVDSTLPEDYDSSSESDESTENNLRRPQNVLVYVRRKGVKTQPNRKLSFPIDTNAARVAVRLGWVPIKTLPHGQEFHLLKKYPEANSIQKPRLSKLDELTLHERRHCQMITFGKVFCTKINPNCNACPVRAEREHYASILESILQEEEEGKMDSSESSMVQQEIKLYQPIEWDMEHFDHNTISDVRGQISKALMVLNTESSLVPVPVSKLKNATYLRTEYQVYELPDWHRVLEGLEERVPNDLCRYLLAIWPKDHLHKDEEDTVCGTLLRHVRTAMKEKFPLNGTFFQANEVFADDESCEFPIKVSRASIKNLRCTTLYVGSNLSTIFRGMQTHEVQNCFRTGHVCFRRFNRKTMEPKSLPARFYLPRKKN